MLPNEQNPVPENAAATKNAVIVSASVFNARSPI
jgi:hypothetical protein